MKPLDRLRWTLGALPCILVLASDQASKWWVLYGLRLPEIGRIELSPVFDLTMVWNYGVSFGQLRADTEWERWALVAMSGIISIVFAIWLTRAERRLTILSLGVVIGGAIGNMIDRVQYGAVADFFDFSGLGFPWVFNVADSAITVGAIMLAIDLPLHPDPPKDKPADPASTP